MPSTWSKNASPNASSRPGADSSLERLIRLVAEEQGVHGFVHKATADAGVVEEARILTDAFLQGQEISPQCRQLCQRWKVSEPLLKARVWALASLFPGQRGDGPDPYEVLGVDPWADADTIKTAFRRLCLQCHPDHHPDDPEAVTRFQRIKAAYDMVNEAPAASGWSPPPDAQVWEECLPPEARRTGLWSRLRHLLPLAVVVLLLVMAVGVADLFLIRPRRAPLPGTVAALPAGKNATSSANGTLAALPAGNASSAGDVAAAKPAAGRGADVAHPTEEVPAVGRQGGTSGSEQGAEPSAQAGHIKVAGAAGDGSGDMPHKAPVSPLVREVILQPVVAAKPAEREAFSGIANSSAAAVPAVGAVEAVAPPVVHSAPHTANGNRTGDGSTATVAQGDAAAAVKAEAADAPKGEVTGSSAAKGEAPRQSRSARKRAEVGAADEKATVKDAPAAQNAGRVAVGDVGSPAGRMVPEEARLDKTESRGGEQENSVSPDRAPQPAPVGQDDAGGRMVALADVEKRLETFLHAYTRDYSRRDLRAFLAHFAPSATENSESLASLRPVYEENFSTIPSMQYRIEVERWLVREEGLQVEGRFALNGQYADGRTLSSSGRLSLDLVPYESTYRVRSLTYSFR